MKPVFVDYETFWSQDHSLSKIHPLTYVMHPETEIISAAIRIGYDGETFTMFGEQDLQEWHDEMDWSDKMFIGHNASGFDALIAAYRFGVSPQAWGCTLAMSRPFYAKSVGGSLKFVAQELGLGEKGSLEGTNTKGKHLKDFTAEELRSMDVYNKQDTDLCAGIFQNLAPRLGKREMKLIDMTIRMGVAPQFDLDVELLRHTLELEKEQKLQLVKQAMVVLDLDPLFWLKPDWYTEACKMLASAAKFKTILEKLGVEVPMKPSPSVEDKMIPALAKSDQAFLDMAEDEDNPTLAALAQARLGVKSTLLETRIQRFLEVAEQLDGKMPVFLNYYGADTTGRWGGSMKLNQQNLPRINPKKHKLTDALRMSMMAPPGYKVVAIDLANIELRVNHFLWQVPSSMKLFQDDPVGADLYTTFAAESLYHIPEDEVTKQERQVGKVAHLGLGFGAGSYTFQRVAKSMGGVVLDMAESQHIVDIWRKSFPEIVQGWKSCQKALQYISYKTNIGIAIDPWGLCTVHEEGIKTPLGMIRYPGLHSEKDPESGYANWWYGKGRRRSRIYGPKVCENLVQHIAREVIADYALAFQATPLGKLYPLAHTVHDELIYVVHDEHAQEVLDSLTKIMAAGVSWWPELITSSEGAIAQRYGEAH